jgi:hypothetical protein
MNEPSVSILPRETKRDEIDEYENRFRCTTKIGYRVYYFVSPLFDDSIETQTKQKQNLIGIQARAKCRIFCTPADVCRISCSTMDCVVCRSRSVRYEANSTQ